MFITVGNEDDTDVATGQNLDAPETQVVLSGEAGGEEWTVVEYVEDDPSIVDEPTTCLRFEPPIEDGTFFCGTEDDLVGAHGRLVLRPGSRFNDHAVFAGVFAPQVVEVTLEVDDQEIVMEPTPWPGRDLGIVVVMLPIPSEVGTSYSVTLRDATDRALSSGSAGRGEPETDVPPSVVAEPGAPTPGQTVELLFPTDMTRDVAWHMKGFDLRSERWSEPLYLLISDRSDAPAAPTWLPPEAEWIWDSVAVTGPGPDTIVIPDTAEAGLYAICPTDGVDFTNCAAVTVQAE